MITYLKLCIALRILINRTTTPVTITCAIEDQLSGCRVIHRSWEATGTILDHVVMWMLGSLCWESPQS